MSTLAGLTLDAGALIAVERGDRFVLELIERARKEGRSVVVPAGALAQVWRGGARQARLARFLGSRSPGAPTVEPMTEKVARWAGEICGVSGSRDVVDASVIICARLLEHAVVTSDPGDLRALDPGVELIVV